MALRTLLSAERIALLKTPGNRAAVLDAAARLLAAPSGPGASPNPPLRQAIIAGLREREQLAPTAIGHGVAIPHARIAGIEESRVAFLRLAHPVDFDAADGEPVDLVVAMVVPEHSVQQHLESLADLAESFADPGYRADLRTAPTLELLRRRLLDGDHAPAAPLPSESSE
jgi:PTS system nitrogen regulatory IIA component